MQQIATHAPGAHQVGRGGQREPLPLDPRCPLQHEEDLVQHGGVRPVAHVGDIGLNAVQVRQGRAHSVVEGLWSVRVATDLVNHVRHLGPGSGPFPHGRGTRLLVGANEVGDEATATGRAVARRYPPRRVESRLASPRQTSGLRVTLAKVIPKGQVLHESLVLPRHGVKRRIRHLRLLGPRAGVTRLLVRGVQGSVHGHHRRVPKGTVGALDGRLLLHLKRRVGVELVVEKDELDGRHWGLKLRREASAVHAREVVAPRMEVPLGTVLGDRHRRPRKGRKLIILVVRLHNALAGCGGPLGVQRADRNLKLVLVEGIDKLQCLDAKPLATVATAKPADGGNTVGEVVQLGGKVENLPASHSVSHEARVRVLDRAPELREASEGEHPERAADVLRHRRLGVAVVALVEARGTTFVRSTHRRRRQGSAPRERHVLPKVGPQDVADGHVRRRSGNRLGTGQAVALVENRGTVLSLPILLSRCIVHRLCRVRHNPSLPVKHLELVRVHPNKHENTRRAIPFARKHNHRKLVPLGHHVGGPRQEIQKEVQELDRGIDPAPNVLARVLINLLVVAPRGSNTNREGGECLVGPQAILGVRAKEPNSVLRLELAHKQIRVLCVRHKVRLVPVMQCSLHLLGQHSRLGPGTRHDGVRRACKWTHSNLPPNSYPRTRYS